MCLKTSLFALLSILVFSCNSDAFRGTSVKNISPPSGSLVSEKFQKAAIPASPQVDIIFGVDTSDSMLDEKALLQDKMNSFLNVLQASPLASNFQIILVGKGFSFPESSSKIRIIADNIKSNNALTIFMGQFGQGGDHRSALRESASKHFLVVSDDNASDESVPAFRSMVSSDPIFAGRTRVGGLVGTDSSVPTSTCGIIKKGTAYSNMAAEFGGILKDLCIENWSVLLSDLATEIADQESTSAYDFALGEILNPNKKIVVKVGDAILDEAQYEYIAEGNLIRIKSSALSGENKTVEVSFYKL